MPVNYLGLDGSLRNFGIAVVSVDIDKKCIDKVVTLKLSKTTKCNAKGVSRSSDDVDRFKQHIDLINQTITHYDIKCAIGEVPHGAKDARAAFSFGGVTAILAGLPVPLIQVTPQEVKKATGDKHADKEDVIQWAFDNYPYAPWFVGNKSNAMNIRTVDGKYLTNANEHLADAVAAVQAGLEKTK